MTGDSLLARRAGDVRLLPAAGYALVLQVAHPTVGAGVREHSDFERDPWGRLLRTLDFVHLCIAGGAGGAAAIGPRLRRMHAPIHGSKPDGTRYHALEREAYAWVHATLVDSFVVAHERFGTPLSPAQREQLYAEWLEVGRGIGVREGDLPAGWSAFRAYFEETVQERLEHTASVDTVLRTLRRPQPPLARLPGPAWAAAWLPAGHALTLATVGLLPPVLRERFGLSWSAASEAELRLAGAASRALTPLLPRSLRVMSPGYLRWRADAIDRGPLSPAGAPRPSAPGARAAAPAP